ncbi:hypothetical protein TNIN_298871 [Trichonephila inaurata madagascariensis]|uniref:Uncharacterized protein n=1 Tax=Trichonephila inaurata madagascariensis TaxID=2747483 RepID=A0A8X6M4Y0_9ARAC|nr:hypothetical protein TNIN_298871 [Trichonephila inaurata madagascariensis]
MIRSFIGLFEELGSVANPPGRGTYRNIRTEDNLETVRQSVADDPSVSTRRRSSQMSISRTTLRRISKLDLKMLYPDYKRHEHTFPDEGECPCSIPSSYLWIVILPTNCYYYTR